MTKRKTQPKTTIKRAGIYVRVSSERQAKRKTESGDEEIKTSPVKQEQKCRELAERQGYPVVEVYRDTEKYRIGRKLVEPSGTRADRPGLRAMLAAARVGEIDVIMAWREDSLYRGYRPMLDVLECVEETGVDVELVMEVFDKKMAPVKAWAARQELDAKHDRFVMGVEGRLEKGRMWHVNERYGYHYEDGVWQTVPDEAEAVRNIKTWYADDVSVGEIRRRLNGSGAPLKKGGRFGWRTEFIQRILRRDYSDPVFRMTWDGEIYELPIEPITDPGVEAHVKQRRAAFKAYRAGNLKAQSLGAGLVHCEACGRRMGVRTRKARGHSWLFYGCLNEQRGYKVDGCAKYVKMDKIDDELWRKVWELISTPGELERRIDERIAELQAEQADATGEVDRLVKELEKLDFERQRVITWARQGLISENDLATQIAALDWQDASLKAELSKAQLATGNQAEQIKAAAEQRRQEILAGADAIQREPETPEQTQRIFEAKRRIVRAWVERADVAADKSVTVAIKVDLSGGAAVEGVPITDSSTRSRTYGTTCSAVSEPSSGTMMLRYMLNSHNK